MVFDSVVAGGTASAHLVVARYQNSASAAATVSSSVLTFATAFSASTFYHFHIGCPTAATAGSWVLQSDEATALGNPPVSSVVSANTGTSFQTVKVLEFNTGTGTFFFDTFNVGVPAPVAPTITPTSLAFTSISGFSIDEKGDYGAVRYTSEDKIQTFVGHTLTASSGTPYDTYCETTYGIDVMNHPTGDAVSFFTCDPDAAASKISLNVRDVNLQAPIQPQQCTDQDFCEMDLLDDECQDDNMSNDLVLAQLRNFPFDYSSYYDIPFHDNFDIVEWAFTTTDGYVGITGYISINMSDDLCFSTYKPVALGQVVNHICATNNPFLSDFQTEQAVVYAGTETSPLASFRVSSDPNAQDHQPTLENYGGPVVSSVAGIGCASDKVAVMNAQGVLTVANTTFHRSTRTITTAGCAGAGDADVALDYGTQGLVGAYECNGFFYIFNTTNLAITGSVAVPAGAGDWGLHLANGGNELYYANNANVYRWDISSINPANYIVVNTAGNEDGDDVPNSIDNDVDGDGICNGAAAFVGNAQQGACSAGPDPDIDGDGFCNGATDTSPAVPTKPAGTPGAINGCVAGDTDNDQDGIPNGSDTQGNGAATGGTSDVAPPSAAPVGGSWASAGVKLGETFGGGDTGGFLLMAVIIIFIFAAVGGVIFEKAPVIGVVIGGVLGFFYSFFVGLVPAGITFGIVAIAAAIGGTKLLARRGSDA